jgi:cellulose synthase/poly-beta-1,6-N-acetylglucosamine synthase-like glycosyltransferase
VAIVVAFIVGWAKLKTFKINGVKGKTKVSIIIAARNEEEKITKTIEDVLSQDYDPDLFELIVIDDHSTDSTAAIIKSYADRGVKLIQLNEAQAINSYKKKAIQTAIGNAKGDLIITTDADCRMRRRWLRTIVNYYEVTGYKMISSPVAYFEEKTFFEHAQSLEFSYLIGLGASTIGNNKPSTCNGANLAYEKDAFYSVGGFTGIDDLASGDDELLLHKIAAKYKGQIGFLKNTDAIVYTHAKPTLGEFIQQRKRWASKSTRYKDKAIVLLGVSVWAFNVSILLNLIWVFVIPGWPSVKFLAFQLCAKIIIEFVFLFGVAKFFRRMQLLSIVPLLSLMHIVYIIYIGIAGNSGKYNWKGRMVK